MDYSARYLRCTSMTSSILPMRRNHSEQYRPKAQFTGFLHFQDSDSDCRSPDSPSSFPHCGESKAPEIAVVYNGQYTLTWRLSLGSPLLRAAPRAICSGRRRLKTATKASPGKTIKQENAGSTSGIWIRKIFFQSNFPPLCPLDAGFVETEFRRKSHVRVSLPQNTPRVEVMGFDRVLRLHHVLSLALPM